MTKQPKSSSEVASIVQSLRSVHIRTPREAEFRAHLDRLLQRDDAGNPLPKPVQFNATGETRGIALIDGAGGGKTTLVDHALRKHPALGAPGDGDAPRYLNVRVPSPATLKSLGLEILRQSGYPEISDRRERWSIWDLVRKRLQLLGMVVLWIDEAHDLFHTASTREIEDMLKTLKSLMQGDGAVIVILTGVESLWQIASFEPQVQRRYSKIRLPPVCEATDGDDVWRLICGYCVKAGLAPPDRGDLVGRLMHASRYRFGRCIENTVNAIEDALHNGDEALDVQHFAESWAMQEGCDPGGNVFLAPQWREIDLDPPAAEHGRPKKRAA